MYDLVPEEFRFKNDRLIGSTNSGFKYDLKTSLINGQISESILAMVELLSYREYDEIWVKVFEIYITYINLKNLNLLLWLIDKYHYFQHLKHIKSDSHILNNTQEIRNLLAQVITILALEPKHKLDIRTHNQITKTSKNTINTVKKYYTMGNPQADLHVKNLQITLLNIIEFYSQGNIKSTYDHIKNLLKIPYEIIPVIKCNKKSLQTKPIMLLWRYLFDQENPESNHYGKHLFKIFTLLNQEYHAQIIYTYLYICSGSKIEHKEINLQFKEVLRQVLNINYQCI